MLRTIFFIVVVLNLFDRIDSAQKPLRKYVAKKDMISGDKASQFSFYSDLAEKNLTYRIESYHSPMQKIDLRTYPRGEEIGRLDAQQLGSSYEARFELKELRNKTNNVWYTGLIKRASAWFGEKYNIHLLQRTIIMKTKSVSSKFRFFDESSKLMAMLIKRSSMFTGITRYEVQIYSNAFPDGVYMLFIAAYDRV